MPFNYNQYMYLVNRVNSHFERHKKSSLHGLNAALRGNHPVAVIQPLIAQLPQAKKTKYGNALNYIQQNYPGMPPVVPTLPARPSLTNAAIEARVAPAVAPVAPALALTDFAGVPLRRYVIDVDPHPHTLVGASGQVDPFTRPQIQQINEAMERTFKAVDEAIKASTKVTSAGTWQQTLYNQFFGAYDNARKIQIVKNFQSIHRWLEGPRGGAQGLITLVDSRNDTAKKDWFAATVRNSAAGGQVLIYVGRSFFLSQQHLVGYHNLTDFTVGTLVHELAHACFGASDVPTVASGGRGALDTNGMPTVATVCNDDVSDRDLAANDPDAAFLNADNYAQFAWRSLAQGGG